MIQKIVVLIVLSTFFISCQCDKYYSNSDEKRIEGKLGNIKCGIVPNVISTDRDHLDIFIAFKEAVKSKIDRESIKVYPIIKKDTLEFISGHGAYYIFKDYSFKYDSDKYKNSKLNLSIKYKLKGDPFIKEEVYKELEQIRLCRWKFVLH